MKTLKITFLLVAFAGDTVAARVAVFPTLTLAVSGSIVTPVTAIGSLLSCSTNKYTARELVPEVVSDAENPLLDE
jgi:hypothetical protein